MSVKRVALGVIVFLALIQIYRPARANPPVDPASTITATTPVNAKVRAILTRSCFDCHSNLTTWPWYSQVAPSSWLVTHDVNHGRARMNFSEWGTYSPRKRTAMLEEICDKVTTKDMPLLPYKLMHPKSWLSHSDVQAICTWAKSAPVGTLGGTATGDSQSK